MKNTTTIVLTAAIALTAAAEKVPDAFIAALRRALDSRATWTMERTFPDTSRKLVSSGTVHCVPGTGIVWTATAPFHSRIAMTPDGMSIQDDFTDEQKASHDMPRYDELFKTVDSFASGDNDKLVKAFEISATQCASNGWHVVVVPKARELRRLVPEITLDGGVTITNAVMRTHDGGISRIQFTEEAHVR